MNGLCRAVARLSFPAGLTRQCSSSSVIDPSYTRRKATLNDEWVELAKKQLKGADPRERLLWHTPEVLSSQWVILILPPSLRVLLLIQCIQVTVVQKQRCLVNIHILVDHTLQCIHNDPGQYDRYTEVKGQGSSLPVCVVCRV